MTLRRIYSFFIAGVFLFGFPQALFALTLGPSKQTIVVDQGQTATANIFVLNDGETPQTYIGEVDAFVASADGVTPVFGQTDEAKKWISIQPATLSLDPGEKGIMTFSISIPQGTAPGAHYLGLFARQQAAEGQVGIASRAGSLLFLYVSGAIEEELQLQELSVEGNFFSKERKLFVQTKNLGNIHIIPKGTVSIKNMSQTSLFQRELNPHTKSVYVGQTWKFQEDMVLPSVRAIGKNSADLQVHYGVSEKIITGQVSFWYIPLWLFYTVGAMIIAVSIFFFRRR